MTDSRGLWPKLAIGSATSANRCDRCKKFQSKFRSTEFAGARSFKRVSFDVEVGDAGASKFQGILAAEESSDVFNATCSIQICSIPLERLNLIART